MSSRTLWPSGQRPSLLTGPRSPILSTPSSSTTSKRSSTRRPTTCNGRPPLCNSYAGRRFHPSLPGVGCATPPPAPPHPPS
eukprot:11223382-Lingulodinium_polyedra.AAC.1